MAKKKLQKLFAVLLTVSMAMSLLNLSAAAAGGTASLLSVELPEGTSTTLEVPVGTTLEDVIAQLPEELNATILIVPVAPMSSVVSEIPAAPVDPADPTDPVDPVDPTDPETPENNESTESEGSGADPEASDESGEMSAELIHEDPLPENNNSNGTDVRTPDVPDPDVPDPDVPDPDVPDPDVPDPDVPGPDVPDPDVPGPDVPGPDVPDPDVPDPDVPGPGVPGPGVPGPDVPGPDVPGSDVTDPDVPDPDVPGLDVTDPDVPGLDATLPEGIIPDVPTILSTEPVPADTTVPVTWECQTEYDPEQLGTYTFIPKLMKDIYDNASEVEFPTINVIVRNIVKVETEEALNAAIGNAQQTQQPTVIDITANIALAETVVIPEGFDITFTSKSSAPLCRTKNAVMIQIEKGGCLTLEKINLNGSSKESKYSISPIACAGNMTLKDGAVISGFHAYQGGGLTVENGGRVIMEGGRITGNTASRVTETDEGTYGGGVFIEDGGTFILEGGLISRNTCTIGISSTASYVSGGGVAVGNGGRFIMVGGSIENNEADGAFGGGLSIGNLTTSGCVAAGDVQLWGGTIRNNSARTGGGIYVERFSTLVLERTAVTNNEAKNAMPEGLPPWMEAFFDGGYGGGVWYCSYGGGHFYATSGGLITNNTAKKSGKDFVAQASFEADIHLASRLHDGTPVEWYQDPGASGWTDETIGDSPIPDLDKYVADWYAEESAPVGQSLALRSETTGSASDSYYDFFVVNNKATMEGGGIACNGTLTMGEDRDMTLTVKKVWKGKPETGHPTSVQVDVHRDGRYLETVTLSEENNWTVTLKDLPAADYTVKERAVTGYAAAYAPDTADSGAPVITITNTYNSGGGGSHEDPDDDPRDDPDPEDIPDEPTPLTPGPEEPPVTPEEPVAELPEEEIPLVEIPKTGDISVAWLALTALSALGLAMVSLRKKREEA